MKKMILAGLLAAALLALPCRARAWFMCGPYRVDVGARVWLNVNPCPGGACPQAGPWYLYWPMEAHFVNPAPTPYPFWPGPMSLPGMQYAGRPAPPPPGVVPPPAPLPPSMNPVPQNNVKPSIYQPVGYTGEVPSYWYGR